MNMYLMYDTARAFTKNVQLIRRRKQMHSSTRSRFTLRSISRIEPNPSVTLHHPHSQRKSTYAVLATGSFCSPMSCSL